MSSHLFLLYFALFPLFTFLVSLLLPNKETWISRYALGAVVSHTVLAQAFTLVWLCGDHTQIHYQGPAMYSSGGIEFILSLLFDKVTAVYTLVGSLLTSLIVVYSRIYMHREAGYKRFFSTLLFFYTGYNLIIFSGNFEMLFMGWEILGISSFLLIAFYQDRYLPVKNAFKVFSIYRFGDVGLILTAWICHMIWHKNIQFYDFSFLTQAHNVVDNSGLYLLLTFALLLSASAKSAQFPFCSWMPRAMEGPTPSSAIFYGSLSVHIGAFILLRTFSLWEGQILGRIAIAIIGLITALICSQTARVQSTIKSQVAYSSLTQIGIIFVEIALGFEVLALIHIAGNAFLRTYQLLVSPSVVSYLIREQFYKPALIEHNNATSMTDKWKNTIYILSLHEWYLDLFLEKFLWHPFKKVGQGMQNKSVFYTFLALIVASGFIALGIEFKMITGNILLTATASLMALMSFLFVLRAFVEREDALVAWSLILANHIWILLAVSTYDALNTSEILVYMLGILVSWVVGALCLQTLKKREGTLELHDLYGYAQKHPLLAFVFFVSCLGLSGFPITPTFIGEDIIFHHIHREEFWVALFISLSYVFDGLCILRIYARLFMGPNHGENLPVARRSS